MNALRPREGDIAIIGMAGRFPGAASVEAFLQNVLAGNECLTDFSEQDAIGNGVAQDIAQDKRFVNRGGILADADCFDADLFRYSAKDASLLDPQHRLFLEICWAALEHAGYAPDRGSGRTAVFGGCGPNQYGIHLLSQVQLRAAVGDLKIRLATDRDFLTSRVAYKLGLTGPAVTVQASCATSLAAVHLACRSLIDGESDLALAGGVSVSFPQRVGYLPDEGSIFSIDGRCRPFDKRASGTVPGSGVGVVVLKRLAEALADEDTIRAVIRGSAMNNDGSAKVGFTAPSADAQAEVIAEALAVAEVQPSEIGFIETHGTGTRIGDAIELDGLHAVFKEVPRRQCALDSVKAAIGHLDAAAGVAGLLHATLAVSRGVIPPLVNFREPCSSLTQETSPFRIPRHAEQWNGRRVSGVSSFGMGGTNVHVVIEGPPAASAPPPGLSPEVILLSAHSSESLRAQIDNLAQHLERYPDIPLSSVAHTLQVGRSRLQVATHLLADTGPQLATALRQHDASSEPTTRCPVVFLFPGQGVQATGMGLSLASACPLVRHRLLECEAILESHLGLRLINDLLKSALTSTDLAQPALFALQYAIGKALLDLGVKPAALAGHSIGEYAAACLAGVMSLRDAAYLVVHRARLMQAQPAGAMLAVELDVHSLEAVLPKTLDIAAFNAPRLQTVAGPTIAVCAFQEILEGMQVACRRLNTSHAYHSRVMDAAAELYIEAFDGIELRAPTIPLVSGLTGRAMTPEVATDPAMWARQLREPVRFADAVREVAQDPSHFVDVGPGRQLAALLRRSLSDVQAHAISAMLPEPGAQDEARPFMNSLGKLWTHGADIDWIRLRGGRGAKTDLPTYPFRRNRYWASTPDFDSSRSFSKPTITSALDLAEALRDTAMIPIVDEVGSIWKDLLGTAPRSDHESFFDAGGDSLGVTRLLALLRAQTGIQVKLAAFFADPTPAALRRLTSRGAPEKSRRVDQIVPDPDRKYEPFPMLDLQHAYWAGRLSSQTLGGVAPQLYLEYACKSLNIECLEHAVNRLVAHHEALRMIALPDGFMQVLADVGPYRIEVLDLSGLPESERQRQLSGRRASLQNCFFDPHCWPLFELKVTIMDDRTARLHLRMDYLITDATGLKVFLGDLARVYANQDAVLDAFQLSLRDCAMAYHQRRESLAYEEAWDYWRAVLPSMPPPPGLPASPRRQQVAGCFRRLTACVPGDVWQQVVRQSKQNQVTPSGALCAMFGEVLSTWSNMQGVTLNLTLANRPPLHPDLARMMGEFTTTTLVPFVRDGPLFKDRAQAITQRLTAALQHSSVSGIELLRELRRVWKLDTPVVMPFVFTSLLGHGTERTDARSIQPHFEEIIGKLDDSLSTGPQVIIDNQVHESYEDQLVINWDVMEAHLPGELAQRLFDAYVRAVASLAFSDTWSKPWLDLRSREEEETVNSANDTDAVQTPIRLEQLFATQTALTPNRTAIIAHDRTLTYVELANEAARITQRLRSASVEPEELVGVTLPTGWRQVASVLGILASGAAYLPLDRDWPPERISSILRAARVRYVLGELPESLSGLIETIDINSLAPAFGPFEAGTQAHHLAYVIYTSGSTGEPKGVAIEHRAAANTLLHVNTLLGINPEDRVLNVSSLTFDLSVFDIFGTLSVGGTLVMPDSASRNDPEELANWIVRSGTTVWNSVPALFDLLVETRRSDALRSLRLAMLSGDWVSVNAAAQARALNPSLALVSLGGATEASIWSIYHPIAAQIPDWPSVPYGRPLPNQHFLVLDHQLRPCPEWVPGELFILGDGLARGYFADPQRTEERFITLPSGERAYRTGDLGRWRPGGLIEFLGRNDTQVKVHGYRVDLAEIEHVIEQFEGIRRAVAVVEDHGAARTIAIYYQLDVPASPTFDNTELQRWAGRLLPDYMVPRVFVPVRGFPLSPNGKVDRARLGSAIPRPLPTPLRGPESPVEERLCAHVAELLGIDCASVTASFFDLGGDSLTAMKLLTRLRSEYGVRLSLRVIYEARSLAELALQIENDVLASIEMAESS